MIINEKIINIIRVLCCENAARYKKDKKSTIVIIDHSMMMRSEYEDIGRSMWCVRIMYYV